MEYKTIQLDKGSSRFPIIFQGPFACPVDNCRSKDCRYKGGKESPTMDVEVKNGQIIVYCYTGGIK